MPPKTPTDTVCPLCKGAKTIVTDAIVTDAITTDAEGVQTTAPTTTGCPRCQGTGRVPLALATL